MKAIYRKELGGYFHTMSGYVYLSIFLMISGYYFVTGNLLSGNGDMKNYFSSDYAVAEWLPDACARECARGFCGHAALTVQQLEFLLALAQGASALI